MFKPSTVTLVLVSSAILAGGHLALRTLVQSPPPLASLALWTAALVAVSVRIATATPQD